MGLMDLLFEKAVNPDLLDQQLKAALGASVAGLSARGTALRVHVLENITEEQVVEVGALVSVHDPGILTETQQISAEAQTARDTLRSLIAERIAWHVANPATGTNAVQVLQRMQTEWVYFMRMLRRDIG